MGHGRRHRHAGAGQARSARARSSSSTRASTPATSAGVRSSRRASVGKASWAGAVIVTASRRGRLLRCPAPAGRAWHRRRGHPPGRVPVVRLALSHRPVPYGGSGHGTTIRRRSVRPGRRRPVPEGFGRLWTSTRRPLRLSLGQFAARRSKRRRPSRACRRGRARARRARPPLVRRSRPWATGHDAGWTRTPAVQPRNASFAGIL